MTIAADSLVEVTLNMLFDNQKVANVYQYNVLAATPVDSAEQYAAAWWNHVKGAYRGLCVSGAGSVFQSVVIRELNNPTGDLAEYAIPAGEQDGSRAAGSLGPFLAGFVAVGARLAVANRTTRPGQKRFLFLTEGDVAGPSVGATFIGLVEDILDLVTDDILLGSPAVGAAFQPIVTRKDATGAVTAWQPVTGYVVNPLLTSQVSRKVGRGA